MNGHKRREGGLRLKKKAAQQIVNTTSFPLISIITPVRNMDKTIERTLCSVINQTYSNIEHIVIDGASTDGTLNIIKKYENRINYWISEPDDGISDAFNKGINLCQGELIGIINGDDWYETDAVEKVVKAHTSEKNVGVVHGNMRLFEKDKPLFIRRCSKDLKKLWINMILNHATCFVDKKCYQELGSFNNDFKSAMDYELMLRFYVNGVKFHYIDAILANVSFGGASDKYEIQCIKESIMIHQIFGFQEYFASYWLSLSMQLIKRYVRKIVGRDNPLSNKIRSLYRETI